MIAATLAKAVVIFASTNVDDILILTTFFADPKFRARSIVIGQYLGMGVLVAISAAAGAAAVTIPTRWISLLGVIPLALGVRAAIDVVRGDDDDNALPPSGSSQVLAVAGVTIANGGDNIGVYVPVFAVEHHAIWLYAVVFAVMIALMCALGFKLVDNRAFGGKLERYGRIALPIVLVALGVYILSGLVGR
jgi:cadmium resistance protein CadD (predicted permease)